MQFSKPVIFLINALIVSIGIIFLFSGQVFMANSVGKEMLAAIGTSLIAAGLINSLDRFITVEAQLDPGIRLVTPKRKELLKEFHDRKYTTNKFALVAVAVKDCLREIAEDHDNKMVNRILFDGVRCHIIFVHPDSEFLEQRAAEDKGNVDAVRKMQRDSVEYAVLFFNKLRTIYEQEKKRGRLNANKIGNVQIKLIGKNPYVTIERFGDEINWGLYTSYEEGKNCAMFSVIDKTDENQSEVFDQLKQHFYALLDEGEPLVTLSNGFLDLNRDVVDPILTKETVEKLLK